MANNDEQKKITNKYFYGNWINEENLEITINITESDVTISQKSNKEELESITFANDTWWVENFLCFTSNQLFFITYADINKMYFGEFESAGLINGKVKWAKTFNRVSF